VVLTRMGQIGVHECRGSCLYHDAAHWDDPVACLQHMLCDNAAGSWANLLMVAAVDLTRLIAWLTNISMYLHTLGGCT
jgi:hypothetical protein